MEALSRLRVRPAKTETECSIQVTNSLSGTRIPQDGIGVTRQRLQWAPPQEAFLPVAAALALETDKVPWLPPARRTRVRDNRRQPHPNRHSKELPNQPRSGWSIRIPGTAPVFPVRFFAGYRAWISPSSQRTSIGAQASGFPNS